MDVTQSRLSDTTAAAFALAREHGSAVEAWLAVGEAIEPEAADDFAVALFDLLSQCEPRERVAEAIALGTLIGRIGRPPPGDGERGGANLAMTLRDRARRAGAEARALLRAG